MISAGSANTAIVSKQGEVYVIGDNTFGQHACLEEEPEAPEVGQT